MKNNIKTVAFTSLFWVSVAGVIILVQFVYHTAYAKGSLDTLRQVNATAQVK